MRRHHPPTHPHPASSLWVGQRSAPGAGFPPIVADRLEYRHQVAPCNQGVRPRPLGGICPIPRANQRTPFSQEGEVWDMGETADQQPAPSLHTRPPTSAHTQPTIDPPTRTATLTALHFHSDRPTIFIGRPKIKRNPIQFAHHFFHVAHLSIV